MLTALFYILFLGLLIAVEFFDIFFLRNSIKLVEKMQRKEALTAPEKKELRWNVIMASILTLVVLMGILMIFFIINGEVIFMNFDYSINRASGTCHIVDSYKVTDKWSMRAFIRDNLSEAPFNKRSEGSYIREWRAHNLLYKLGICTESTKDTDLDINEPMWRRIGYFFLSLLYFGK